MSYKIIAAILLIIVLLLGGYFLLKNGFNSNLSNNQNNQSQNSPTPTQAPINPKVSNVTVTKNGFEPQALTISVGTTVIWTNKSGGSVTVNSDVYPTNLVWPFLNLGQFDDNSSVSVVFDKKGKYTYHNHLNPNQTGSVIVQ